MSPYIIALLAIWYLILVGGVIYVGLLWRRDRAALGDLGKRIDKMMVSLNAEAILRMEYQSAVQDSKEALEMEHELSSRLNRENEGLSRENDRLRKKALFEKGRADNLQRKEQP